jgi:LysR family glycine cleavage system transcriptional activator
MKAHPEVAVSVTAVADLPPLLQGLFDAGFWYGHGKLPGVHAEPLVGNYAFPICKPAFLKGDHALRSPADLARCTLLESSDEAYYQYKEPRQPAWAEWLRSAGVPAVTGVRSLNFTPRLMVHRAVTAGAGVGLSRTLLAVDAIEAKEVVVPFGPGLPQTATYHLLHATNLSRRRDVAAFRNWVLSEVEASASKIARLLRRMGSR